MGLYRGLVVNFGPIALAHPGPSELADRAQLRKTPKAGRCWRRKEAGEIGGRMEGAREERLRPEELSHSKHAKFIAKN